MFIASLLLLAILASVCAIGACHPAYDDNLLQRLGLGVICLACVALGAHVWATRAVLPACFLMACGLVLFAAGVVVKVWRFSREARQPLEAASHPFEVHP